MLHDILTSRDLVSAVCVADHDDLDPNHRQSQLPPAARSRRHRCGPWRRSVSFYAAPSPHGGWPPVRGSTTGPLSWFRSGTPGGPARGPVLRRYPPGRCREQRHGHGDDTAAPGSGDGSQLGVALSARRDLAQVVHDAGVAVGGDSEGEVPAVLGDLPPRRGVAADLIGEGGRSLGDAGRIGGDCHDGGDGGVGLDASHLGPGGSIGHGSTVPENLPHRRGPSSAS